MKNFEILFTTLKNAGARAAVAIGLFGCGLVAPMPVVTVASAQDISSPKVVTAVGVGQVKIPATQGGITLGIQHTSTTAKEALQKVSIRMKEVIENLKKEGIGADSLQTNEVSLSRQYEYDGSRRVDRGFLAQQTLSLTAPITQLGKLLDASVSLGINEVGAILLSATDQEKAKAKDAAIAQASLDAKRQAEMTLSTLGLSPKGVRKVTVFDSVDSSPISHEYSNRKMNMEIASVPAPIEGGNLTIMARVQVDVEF